jgi:hypothetical protein
MNRRELKKFSQKYSHKRYDTVKAPVEVDNKFLRHLIKRAERNIIAEIREERRMANA